jgi:hypothetical protein
MDNQRPKPSLLRWCGSCVVLLLCWGTWLVLGGLLAVQVWVATRRELTLPDFALRAVERRLAASQVTAHFGRAVFDPTGRVVIEDVQLFSPAFSTPLITLRAAYGRVDFWALLVGDLRLHEVRVTGVDLHLPAMLSPSGADEAVVSDLDGEFALGRSDYDIALCTFQLAGVDVTAHGGFHLPAAVRPRPGSLPLLDLVLQRYLTAGRKLAALRPQLDALEEPRLQLAFTPSADRGAAVDAELSARAYRPAGPFNLTAVRAHAMFPLLGETPHAARVVLEVDRGEWRGQAAVEQLRVDLAGLLTPDRFAFTPQTVLVTAARGEARGIPVEAPWADLGLDRLPRVRGAVALEAGGAPLEARGEVDAKTGAGWFDLEGALTPQLLQRAAGLPGLAVAKWVTLRSPARVRGQVELAAGWTPARAEADVAVGPVIARDVALDAAGAHVVYAGRELRVTDLVLHQGDNVARGSYTMDTATRDYRFLLQGRLRPLDISGWFKDWWPRFWAHFDFSAAPSAADVDVSGRWKAPERSSVFCYADADRPQIRGVPFDRVRTTLFIRPFYYDVFEFVAEHAGHSARGSFLLTVEPHRALYRTLDFDAVSDLDPAECARLYGPAGATYLTPYQYDQPPRVHLTGHLAGADAPGGRQTKVNLALTSPGRFAFHGFPLEHLKFDADFENGDLNLRQVEAGFAGGSLTGSARLEGPPEARTLAFNAKLKGADLVRAANSLEEVQLPGKPTAHRSVGSRFLSRASGGRLDLTLKAEGRYRQPYSFQGDGELAIADKQLGEINLLGLLSELLSKTLLNFTSLRLDAGHASFKIEGNKLAFTQVKLTGPSAAIEAKGDYWLEAKTLDFYARVLPLQESSFVLADALGALLTPLSSVLELRLTGSLEKPSWNFVFGPLNILRLIARPLAGSSPGEPPPAAAPTPAAPGPATTPAPIGPAAPAGP